MNMVSPNDMMKAAKEQMIKGREPESRKDWELIVNFMACNIHKGLEDSACQLVRKIYNVPLSESDVSDIAAFQENLKP